MVSNKLKIIYNTVLSQTISNDGKYMFYGNNYGDIFVQYLGEGYETTDTDCYSFDYGPITSLCFYKDVLLMGANSMIYAHKWSNEKLETKKVSFQISINNAEDINTFEYNEANEQIFVGCGNNSIYQICLKTKSILHEYKEHTNFIHCVKLYDTNLFSASEDGQIIQWDITSKQIIKKLQPCKEQKLIRSEFGNWLGSVAVYNDWLICGGGTKASLWHLPSSELILSFHFPGKIHFCDFIDETILIAGEYKSIFYYSLNGDKVGEVESKVPAVYNVTYKKNLNFMVMSGASNKIINFTDTRFVDYYKKLYKE